MPDTDASLGLPAPFGPGDFDGPLDGWIQHLEWTYLAIVQHARVQIGGKSVAASGGKAADGRDLRFWHLVTTDAGGGARRRQLDLVRAANLPRVWALLELLAAGDPRACAWRDDQGRLNVAPADYSMRVVLSETPYAYHLLTAFPIRKRCRQAALRARAEAARAAYGSPVDGERVHRVWSTKRHETRRPAAGRRARFAFA